MRLFTRDTVYSPGRKIGDYTVKKMTGEGRYGICYLVSDEKQLYIFKQLKKSMLKKSKLKVMFEQEILSSLNHRSVPRFVRKIEDRDLCGYLLEYKDGKSFEDLIYSEGRIFPVHEIHDIGMQLISILKYLHQQGVVHRDIRVPNVLYSDQQISLLDFGLARWIDNSRYLPDVDFAYLGDFLLHLHYTSYETRVKKNKPWHEELNLSRGEMMFLKRLLGIERKYNDINEVEHDYLAII